MTLRDFLHFPRNHSSVFSARPSGAPISVGSPAIPVVDEDLEIVAIELVTEDVVDVLDDEVIHTCAVQEAWLPVWFNEGLPSLLFVEVLLRKSISDYVLTYVDACEALFGSLFSTENPGDIDPFLPDVQEAHSSHEVLCNLPNPASSTVLMILSMDVSSNKSDFFITDKQQIRSEEHARNQQDLLT
ncbi:hypothetical protein Tco_0086447, partial [Tanacetum coccineum]